MKKDWTYKKLGEVAKVQNGFAFKSTLFRNEGCPIVRISNIQNEEIDTKGIVYFNKEDYDVSFDGYKIFPNDILIAMSGGTTGKIGINQTDKTFYQNQRVGVIREDEKNLNHRYLYYYLHTKSEESLKIAAGAAQPNLSTAQIKNFEIPLPSLSEQSRIVSRLDAAFGEIEGLKAKAEAQLSEARTLFQAALTQEMKPKQGWEEKKLKEIGTTQTGTTPSKTDKDNYGDFIPFIRPSEIDYDGCGSIKYDSEIKLSEKGLSNGRLFKAGSILMVCIGATISKVGVTSEDVSCNQQINVLNPKQEYDSKFIYFAMRNEDFKQKVIKEGTSSQATLPIINKGKWENLSLSLPPLQVQQQIVSRLDALSEKVRELEEAQKKVIAECDALKQALLREVFE